MIPSPTRLHVDRACVVLVDVQERLHPAMDEAARARVEKYAPALVAAAAALKLPVIATEQYPRGLGPLLAPLRAALPSPPIEKTTFSCWGAPAFVDVLMTSGRRQVLLAGEETHVCVFQTARDLVDAGFEVHVCADAVASRTEEHRRVGLELCRAAGALVTTTETALFDLLGRAGTPEFKSVSALIK